MVDGGWGGDVDLGKKICADRYIQNVEYGFSCLLYLVCTWGLR